MARLSKLLSMREAIAEFVPDGASVALGLQMEQMIPFAAGQEMVRQRKHGLTLIGPISDILFDQLIGSQCVERVIAAWVGNVMMGSAYNFRRAVEQGSVKVVNMTNFTLALALQAGAMGVPFLPTWSALGSEIARENDFFAEIESPFAGDQIGDSVTHSGGRARPSLRERVKLHAVRALNPDLAIVHLQRADRAFFRQYHEQTKAEADSAAWLQRWIYGVGDRREYMNQLGACRGEELGVKQHAYAAQADFGY